MSNQTLEKPCKFNCGFLVVWKGKTGEPGSTGFFEKGSTIEHKFDRCREIKAKGIKQILPEQSSKQQQPLPKEQTTLPIKEDTSITMGSLFNMGLGTKNEVRELKKQVETLLELVDSLSQQMSLVIKQTGYPEPKPATAFKILCENCGKPTDEIKRHENMAMLCPECFNSVPPAPVMDTAERDLEKNIKELNEVFAKAVPAPVVDKEAFEATQQKIKEELEQDKKEEEKIIRPHLDRMTILQDEPTDKEKIPMSERIPEPTNVVDGDKRWFEISEKFVCISCKNVFHNGWENRAGTKLCDECKTESEASIEAMKYSEQRDEFIIGGDDISF